MWPGVAPAEGAVNITYLTAVESVVATAANYGGCLLLLFRVFVCLVCLSLCLSVCRSVCLSVCLPACLPVCRLSVSVSSRPLVSAVCRPSICLTVCLSVCLPACLSACLPACLSVCLPACLSVVAATCFCRPLNLSLAGIYLLLDMHQDLLSPFFCGEGAPDYLVQVRRGPCLCAALCCVLTSTACCGELSTCVGRACVLRCAVC
jgi:hypothetical protein